jgi:HD domain/Bacterial regulatory proteins, luxR family
LTIHGREQLRLHPHFTERAFTQSPALAPIGIPAGSHHERLEGSGYHRSTRGPALDQATRILAAADCYGAMREARPYRPALDAPAAEAELIWEAEEERLDPEAVDAVLAAAAHRVRERPRELFVGLTERELEVLLVLVRGESNQEIAVDLGISAKTSGTTSSTSTRRPASQPGCGDTLGLRARPRSHRIGRSPDAARASARTLAGPSASSSGAENQRGGER